MGLPADYVRLLEHLGRAFTAYHAATSTYPILVGGAATAIGTAGGFMSADFDVIAADDHAFATAMRNAGFIAQNGLGHLAGGFVHPDHPSYVVEQVSGPLFDGRADGKRLIRLNFTSGSDVVLPAIEDLIADRLAQHAVASRSDDSRLRQAISLLHKTDRIDRVYLRRRIIEEGGDPALIGV